MSEVTLQALVDMAGAQARKIMVGTKEELMPCFLLQTETEVHILGTPWADSSQKAALIEEVRRWAKKIGAVRYSFLCEAWQAKVVDENDERPASERPDREEIVMAVASDGKETVRAQWAIKRQDGVCVGLEKDPTDIVVLYDRMNILDQETRH
jgi:hypothetical protein